MWRRWREGESLRAICEGGPRPTGEVAGIIYLDPTDLHSREQEIEHLRAIGYTAEGAAAYVTRYRQDFADYIATLPPVVQVEMKLIDDIERSDAPEFQRMPPVPSVPISSSSPASASPGSGTGVRACPRCVTSAVSIFAGSGSNAGSPTPTQPQSPSIP